MCNFLYYLDKYNYNNENVGLEITFSTSLKIAVSGYQVSAEVGGIWEMIPTVLTFSAIERQSAEVSEADMSGNISDIDLPEDESDMVYLLKMIIDTMDMSGRSHK